MTPTKAAKPSLVSIITTLFLVAVACIKENTVEITKSFMPGHMLHTLLLSVR